MKSSLSILAGSLMVSHLAAANEVSFTAWSSKDCGTDTSKAFTEQSHEIRTWKTTPKTIKCATTTIEWGSWPQENGKYTTFIDSGKIKDKCQLIFYNGAPNDDDSKESRCFTPYRSLDSTSGCASVSLPKKYGLVYCCGDDCGGPLPVDPGKREEKTENKPHDVTEVKRAPVLKRLQGQQNQKKGDDKCTFNKAAGKVKTHYNKPKKSSATVKCPPDAHFDCQISGEYSTTSSVSHSDSQTNSISVGGGIWGISASYGHDWTGTDESSVGNSFSRSYTLSVGPGSSGYLIFTAKTLCGTGSFEGNGCDKALKVGKQEWCIPALVKGENGTMPDGEWSILQTN
ncbi:hypothetical protein F5B20DRAFT_558347 [Whalleya microplaca]|nr:hypothetical protein F5B20DRAFT_558347 [Whalleya microplaca]